MRKLAKFVKGQDVASFMEKEFNDAMTTLETLGVEVEGLKNPFPVGTLISSVLSVDKFQSWMGRNWILANGQGVLESSQYFRQTGSLTVPNLTGHIAGINFFVRIN